MALLKKKELKDITEKKKIIQHMKKEENKLDVEKEYKETVERVGNKKEVKQPEIKERKIKKKIKKSCIRDVGASWRRMYHTKAIRTPFSRCNRVHTTMR